MYMAMMMTAAASEMHNGKRIYSKDSYTDLGDYKKSNTQRCIKHENNRKTNNSKNNNNKQ